MVESKVRQVWSEYAEQRKNQVGEYHILNQTFTLKNNVITLLLNNPIEDPLLQGMKSDLVGYLREKLNNSTLQVEGEMQQNNTKRKAYTNKEKFDYLVEKNPLLKELQERLGLDPDY
jgi:DNA polymerase-3 subunit gamma/tau